MVKCTVINNETGEIVSEEFNIDTIEEKQRKKDAAVKDKLSKEFKQLQQDFLGNFIFFIFRHIDYLKQTLNDSDLVRFIFLGTYIKSNGALQLDNNLTYIDKRRLKLLLNLSDKVFKTFYDKLIHNNLLMEQGNILYINLNYFWRGKESQYKKMTNTTMQDFTRLYIKTVRELYYNAEPKTYKKLGIVFKLLPFVNWKYNILCDNINETNKELINPITIAEVMDVLGYDKSNITRFKKDFYSLKYKQYPIFLSVQKETEYLQSFILANPLLFYRGNDIKELEYLITLFQIKKNN